MWGILNSAAADLPSLPRDPEVPWEGDPNIAALSDERLAQLWNNIVKRYRRINPMAAPASGMSREPLSSGKDKEVQEYVIDSLDRLLHEETIDWNSVYTVVLLMLGGMEADPRIPELVRYMYQLPRPIKMSDPHGRAYAQALNVLKLQESVEAATVLFDAVDRDFWGQDPYHDRPKRTTMEAIYSLRSVALSKLAEMPSCISLPFLEKLAEKYPLKERTPEAVSGQENFEKWLQEDPDGFIPTDLQTHLKKAREQAESQVSRNSNQ